MVCHDTPFPVITFSQDFRLGSTTESPSRILHSPEPSIAETGKRHSECMSNISEGPVRRYIFVTWWLWCPNHGETLRTSPAASSMRRQGETVLRN